MSYQGPCYALDSVAEDFWLDNPTLASLAAAPAITQCWFSTSDQLGKIGVQAATPEIHSEGVCLHRPIPAELSLESDEEIGHLLS